MPGTPIRFVLTITSLTPALLVFAAVFFFNDDTLWSWSGYKVAAIGCVVGVPVLAYVCHKVIQFFKTEIDSDWKKFESLQVADKSAITFVVVYLLPLARTKGIDVQWGVLIVVLLLVAILVFHSDAYLVNPLLAMPPFRYHFYEVTTDEEVTFILVSRREIVNTREPVEVQQISRYMFLEVEGQGD